MATRPLCASVGGNLKSLVLKVFFTAPACVLDALRRNRRPGFFTLFSDSWLQPTVDRPPELRRIQSQELGAVIGGLLGVKDVTNLHLAVGAVIAVLMLIYIFKSSEYRGSFDNILGGAVIGLAVVAGWWITGGPLGKEWLDWAQLSPDMPSRVAIQSYTFISPMGDTALRPEPQRTCCSSISAFWRWPA